MGICLSNQAIYSYASLTIWLNQDMAKFLITVELIKFILQGIIV